MNKTLLMVGIGVAGRPFLDSAKRLGFAVHGVEVPERKVGYVGRVSAFTDCRGLIDELWAEAAEIAVRDSRPDGVLAFNEPHVMGAALVQDRLGLPGPSLRAAAASRNKALQRAVFAAAKIPQPAYYLRDDIRDAREWAAWHLPVLVKPLSLTGGAGLEYVADEQELDAMIARRTGTGKLLVEAEVTGPEYSWVAVIVNGEVKISNISSTETSGPPHFVELVHRTPAVLPAEDRQEINAIAARALDALGMRTGIMQLECKMTTDGPSVIEAAVRMPGDGMMELLELTYEINWYDLMVMAAMGHDLPELPAGPSRYAAGYDPPLTAGLVTEITGFDEIRDHPMVVSADLTVAPGNLVPTSSSSVEVAGEILMGAPTSDELEELLAHVRHSLRIETAPSDTAYEPKHTSVGASIYPLF
jgi:predicted ATP-grasp superfamily ATP-dependent carboligase